MFFGWRVVVYAFLMALWSSGLGLYGLSVFLVALQKQNAWPASTVSFGIAAYFLIGAALIAGLGDVMRLFGQRRAVLCGICCMAAGVFGLTWVTEAWQLYAAFTAMAVGWATTSNPSINMVLAPWFERRRGLAVSLAMTGATCGGIIVAPLLLPLIGALGFRLGVGLAVLAMLAMLLPFGTAVLGRNPADLGVWPDGAETPPARHPAPIVSVRAGRVEALRTRRYWTLSIAFALEFAAQIGLLTHLVALVAPLHGITVAAEALSVTTLSALIARVIGGSLVDRYDRRIVTCAVFLTQAVGVFMLTQAAWPWALYAGCILFGSGVGNVTILPHLLVHKEFRPDQFAGVVSLLSATLQVTFAFAPSILGLLRDATGSYQAALALCICLELVAGGVILLGRQRQPIGETAQAVN